MTSLIAHRGASLEYPENTLLSIKKAIEYQAEWIEIDIRLSKDGIPVVIHDETLSRTGKEETHVHDLTWSELKAIDVGSYFHESFHNEKVPSLEEVLLLPRGRTKFMLELKEGINEELLCYAVKDLLFKTNTPFDSLILGSFSINILEILQKVLPEVSLIGILEDIQALPYHLELNLNHLALWYPLMNKELIKSLNERKVRNWVFTVDDLNEAKKLKEMSIQGIITNDIKTFQSGLKAL